MKLEKLSTKDWKSPRLCLINNSQPKSKQSVAVYCHECKCERTLIFAELIRSVNKQSKHVDFYHCPQCFRSTESYRNESKSSSIKAIDKITKGASQRSKNLWNDPNYRQKMLVNSKNLSESKEFREKVSKSVRNKFINDSAYLYKIKEARRKYWKNPDYRSSRTWSSEDFIKLSILEHGDKYDYSNVAYRSIKLPVIIVCKKHGPFSQRPSHHIFYGNGCPKCALEIKESEPQIEIKEWIVSLGFEVVSNDREILEGLELDIYVPKLNFAIEYHGGYWHSYNRTESTGQRMKHARKSDIALEKGVNLLQIFDVEWRDKNDIVKSMIRHRLGISTRVYARKCRVVEVDSAVAHKFCDNNHISGRKPADFYRGLEYAGDLISMISLSKNKNGSYEIERYCSKIGFGVIGGLSKLLNSFDFDRYETYADRRYSTAVGYVAAGFKIVRITKPGYYYWRNNNLYNRRSYQKVKQAKKLAKHDNSLTEAQNMFNNGFRRIWDAGHYRLEKR